MLRRNQFPYPESNTYLAITGTDSEYLRKYCISGDLSFYPMIFVSSSKRCIEEQINHGLPDNQKLYALFNLVELKQWYTDYTGQDIVDLCDSQYGKLWFISFNKDDETIKQVCCAKDLIEVIEYCNLSQDCIPHCVFTEKELARIIWQLSSLARGETTEIPYVFIDNYYYSKSSENIESMKACLYSKLNDEQKQAVDEVYDNLIKKN